MRKILGVTFGVLCCGVVAGRTLSFIGGTDKNAIGYQLNEPITFTVKLVDTANGNAAVTGEELRWTLKGDDTSLNRSGTQSSDSNVVVTTSLSSPGFVRLNVDVYTNGVKLTGSTEYFEGGAGAAVTNLTEWPAPTDFDTFWDTATNTLYATAYTPVCTNFTPAGAASGVEYYLFEIPTFSGEKPVTGILAKPEGATAKSCGILALFNGYGWGKTSLPSSAQVLANGGTIVINVARHGEYPWCDDATYYTSTVCTEMGIDRNGVSKGYCWRNNDTGDARDTDYYKMLMRDLRALQFAKSLPEWDGKTLATSGGSMGGYQALGCAALDSAVTSCSATIPWSADLASGVKYGRMTGWRPDWTESLDYIDLKNLAKRVTCSVTSEVGLGDYVCPPSGEIRLYQNLGGAKKMTFTQNRSHNGRHGPTADQYTLQYPEPEPEPVIVIGRNLKWTGGASSKNWSVLGNWLDTDGNTNAIPASHDVLTIAGNPTSSCKNDIKGLEPYQLKLSGYQEQNRLSEALVFRADTSAGIYNTGYLHYDIPSALQGTNVAVYSSSMIVCRNYFFSNDGKPCGIRKTGTGGFQFNLSLADPASTVGMTGFKYIDIAEGTVGFGFNGTDNKINTSVNSLSLLPADMVVTFSGRNTSLLFRGDCTLTNLWLRETGDAVGAVHAMTGQTDNGLLCEGRLIVKGTPPVDVTVFTGTMKDMTGLVWAPDSSAKEFVFKGGISTTTGRLEVANGTVRLTDGASFTKLNELNLTGAAAVLAVDDAPSSPIHAKKGTMVSGSALKLATGVQVTFGGLNVDGVRMSPGTYGAGGTAADWISGGGSVVVEGYAPARLNWVKGNSNKNWSNSANWINTETGLNDVPKSGDTLYQTSDSNSAKYNDISGLELKELIFGGGYSNPYGNEITFRAGTKCISSDGYMWMDLPLVLEGTNFTIKATSMTGIRKGIRSYDANPCGFVKTGSGQLPINPRGGSWKGLKYMSIREGSLGFCIQGDGDVTKYLPTDLVITFENSGTRMDLQKECVFTNLTIRETGAAVNASHTIGTLENNGTLKSGTLVLAGPALPKATTFTGYLKDALNFTFASDDTNCVFTFSGTSSKSITTNCLTVTGGTVELAKGATFTQLNTLTLRGTGARFAVSDEPATAFRAKSLVLDTGAERVRIAGGLNLAVDAAKAGGTTLAAGVYCSMRQVGGTPVAWIEGMGYLLVGGASAPAAEPSGDAVAAIWTAGGADDKISTAANWSGNTLPDFDSGLLAPTFAAGTGATLDQVAKFKSLVLNAPAAWTFSAADGAWAALGSGGLGTAGTAKTYAFGWPIHLWSAQTWTVGAGDILNVNANLSGRGGRLTLLGSGRVNFNAAIGHDGEIAVSNSLVFVNADDGLGTSAAHPILLDMTRSQLYLNGVTVNRTVKNIGTENFGKGLYTAANTTNVLNGDLDVTAPYAGSLHLGNNSSLRIKGQVKRATTAWFTFAGGDSAAHRATLHFDAPIDIEGGSALTTGSNIDLYLNAPSNDLGHVWLWFNQSNARLFTTVPYALASKTDSEAHNRLNAWGASNAQWDLCGCDQALDEMGSTGGFTVTSEKPATFHLKSSNAQFTWVLTNRCVFAGAVSFSFEGKLAHRYEGTATSTGIVSVSSSELKMIGSWPNASEACVKGGTLTVTHRGAFSRKTDLVYTAGTLKLDNSDDILRMRDLYVNGEKQRQGLYGAANNESVPSDHRLAWISGTGRVRFYGPGPLASAIFLR